MFFALPAVGMQTAKDDGKLTMLSGPEEMEVYRHDNG
jgi:hypothetical protein